MDTHNLTQDQFDALMYQHPYSFDHPSNFVDLLLHSNAAEVGVYDDDQTVLDVLKDGKANISQLLRNFERDTEESEDEDDSSCGDSEYNCLHLQRC